MFHRMTSRYTAEGGTAVEKSRKGTKKERRTRQGAQREHKGQDTRKQRNSIMQKSEASRFCPRLLREDENRKQTFVGA
ncbi:hypothetical protein PL498_05775 [Bacteroides xylanisolvens]|jgi:hypothetical protein|uniref:hypothetical protein n=1 Tax=Bacteroides TaxID=816 RepID=UPI00230701A1|nr:hypothetical protein [Bacteroides xylanisolvens]MDB0716776.1 hypothetical protein [Bacteroides xylanisolvens]MDB0735492.1 hypothetical protein [Bacteroides xylanisolvens]